MLKTVKFVIGAIAGLAFAGQVFAFSPVTARIQQPQSPTGNNNLTVNVVAMDINGRAVSVQCYKKGPLDGSFSTLGGPISLIAGGNNTANCTPSPVLTSEGTYLFYATATAGADSVATPTVSVDYKTNGPGTPTSYSKSRINSCDYKISFHTADDGGKTVKVEVYRSTSTNFSADNSTKVDTITIGSNADGSSTTTAPDCSKDYYFVIRAFDSIGNGSGLIGDSVVTTTGTTTTTTTTGGSSGVTSGAIAAGTQGNVLGQTTGPTGGKTGGSVEGAATPSASETPAYVPPAPQTFSKKTIALVSGIAILVFLAWYFWKKQKSV